VGWQEEKRIYACPIHIDIKDGKIWIQQDFTEAGIAQQLLDQVARPSCSTKLLDQVARPSCSTKAFPNQTSC
jgi:hypothetical protein